MAGKWKSDIIFVIIIMQKYDRDQHADQFKYVAFGSSRIVDRFDFGHWNLGPSYISATPFFQYDRGPNETIVGYCMYRSVA